MVDGYDSTIIANIPRDAGAVVCYSDLRFRNIDEARLAFPALERADRVISLTAATGDADGIDIEPGNARPDAAPGWYWQQTRRGRWRPVFYADLSDMEQVISNLRAAGVRIDQTASPDRPVRIFTAHPTGERHLCGPATCGFRTEADATQWWWSSISDPGGPDLDKDVFRDDFFPGAPAPTPTPTLTEADMIHAVVNQDGRLEVFVEKADSGEVFHAYQDAKNGGWAGAQASVRNAAWYSLGVPGK